MTAILSDFDLPGRTSSGSKQPARATDAIQHEMASLRARVRALAEKRAGLAADQFTSELRILTHETARAMDAACEDRRVLVRLRHRLARQVDADLLRLRADDQDSVEARARALLLAQLDALLETQPIASRRGGSVLAHTDLTPGTVKAMRILDQHRDAIRRRFRALKCRLQTELADLSREMAGETAARLCLRHGQQGQEWLWWRLARIVDHFVAVSAPASLPAQLELLATRCVLSGVEKHRNG
jgi:uncharacterized protein YukE